MEEPTLTDPHHRTVEHPLRYDVAGLFMPVLSELQLPRSFTFDLYHNSTTT